MATHMLWTKTKRCANVAFTVSYMH